MSKIIAVHGATGMQGGSVVRSLLNSEWKVRAITRNTTSTSAKALSDSGVEVVAANFDDEASLTKAYEGVEAIFLVTNYWEHIYSGKTAVQSGEAESVQALTSIKAASKVPGLKHFIWSTLPGNAEGKSKRIVVHHFDFKAKIDHLIKKDYPELAAKTTYLYVGYYANNLANFPAAKPFVTPSSYGTYFWLNPCSRKTVFPSAGDVNVNVGVFTSAILAQPDKTLGKYVGCIADSPTGEEILNSWVKATGKNAAYLEVNGDDWNTAFGEAGTELCGNLKAFEQNPRWAWDNDPLTAKDLGIEDQVVGTAECLIKEKDRLL